MSEMLIDEESLAARINREETESAARQREGQGGNPLRPPRTGYEAFRLNMLAQSGGKTIKGSRGGKVRFDKSVLGTKDPGQAEVNMRKYYAGMKDSGRQQWEAQANDRDIRSGREDEATARYDQARLGSLYAAGPGAGGASSATPASSPATSQPSGAAPQRMASAPSGGEASGMAKPNAQMGYAEMTGKQTGPMSPKRTAPTVAKPRVGYDGTPNTPMISADQFRAGVAQSRSGTQGKSERIPSGPGRTGPSNARMPGLMAAGAAPGKATRQPKGWDGMPLTAQGKAQTNARLSAANYNQSSLVAQGESALAGARGGMAKANQPVAPQPNPQLSAMKAAGAIKPATPSSARSVTPAFPKTPKPAKVLASR